MQSPRKGLELHFFEIAPFCSTLQGIQTAFSSSCSNSLSSGCEIDIVECSCTNTCCLYVFCYCHILSYSL